MKIQKLGMTKNIPKALCEAFKFTPYVYFDKPDKKRLSKYERFVLHYYKLILKRSSYEFTLISPFKPILIFMDPNRLYESRYIVKLDNGFEVLGNKHLYNLAPSSMRQTRRVMF